MFYNDDDIESKQDNWKNSEVVRIFADNFFKKDAAPYRPQDVTEMGDLDDEAKESWKEYYRTLTDEELSRHISYWEVHSINQMTAPPAAMILAREVQKEERIKEDAEVAVNEEEVLAEPPLLKEEFLHDIDVAIRKLATMAEQSDNETVRYKIERAIMDLEAKKQENNDVF